MVVNGKKVSLGIPNAEQLQEAAAQQIPIRRCGTVNEAAGSILMLCSPFASYITGHTLEVTGGAGI
jgi:3-oxoacyl-[acyl-carrier protein] reductase